LGKDFFPLGQNPFPSGKNFISFGENAFFRQKHHKQRKKRNSLMYIGFIA
jgi:hypothetical protein